MNTNNEQLEAAKGWYKIAKEQNNNVAIEILENIFPELAESEDEKIRKAIITHFENIHKREKLESFYGVDIEPILAWLEKQANQKPAWSEEDEITRKDLINLVEMYYGGVFDKTEKNRLLNFLKSLRLQNTWKPSDAQMASITCAVRKMIVSACYDSELVSLYNDLRKLTE